MDVSLFDYHLPRELIAQFPSRQRDESRLLILDRATGQMTLGRFEQVLDYFHEGDALVVNDTRVFKARLYGKRLSGGSVEVFLVRKLEEGTPEKWEAMARPSRRLREGEVVIFSPDYSATLVSDQRNGRWTVAFESAEAREQIIERFGHVPLPQYIGRPDQPSDIQRYQTVYAHPDKSGAVAAPTAGFHFTSELLERVAQKGVEFLRLTLHVGPGTFKPITAEDINDHTVDPEYAEISPSVAAKLNAVRERGNAVYVVGTTGVRTLEAAPILEGQIQPFAGMVDLYIKPGYRFRMVDHLITNFHLPKSSLLVLVSAYAGRERIIEAYRKAIAERFRFYSYGDAMLIL